jgi:hypothetical protein
MVATGFSNSWTGGEICEDAWDRVELQPVQKGCEEATNWILRIAGPLAKRRGFWDLGPTDTQVRKARIIPFVKSVDDALALELGHNIMRVWTSSGARLLDGGGHQVQLSTPWPESQLEGLRYKQVGDVIYFRHKAGWRPYTLVRRSNTDWAFTPQGFTNGPWLPENTLPGLQIQLLGTADLDNNPHTDTGCILAGTDVTIQVSQPTFTAGHVGSLLRLRRAAGAANVMSWQGGLLHQLGFYAVSDGRVYRCINNPSDADKLYASTPPIGEGQSISDGLATWQYRHDGAGVVQITSVIDGQTASGHVLAGVPLKNSEQSSYWSQQAYSDAQGWPRMWPTMREERLVDGATAANLDMIDLTGTASFGPTSADFKPGLGTGQVLDTDAIRRRVGGGGAEILWSHVINYLVVGTTDGEYLIAGSVLDEPLSPSAVTVKPLSDFGSADVYPQLAHKGLVFVTLGGQALRTLEIDTQQGAAGEELTVLATHIGDRGFVQLAWVKQPDNVLWCRLADGGLATMSYHKEQQVRGFTRQQLPGGWVCEDMAVLPGPGKAPTLWMVVARSKNSEPQRRLWMLSTQGDKLFLDGASNYQGAPATGLGGLEVYEGEALCVLADGAMVSPDPVVTAGRVSLSAAASSIVAGLRRTSRFKSLRLDVEGAGHGLNSRQRVVGATVSLMTAQCTVGIDGALDRETVSTRSAGDFPAATARRVQKNVTLGGDTSRDPRLVIEDDSPYDARIYSIKPHVQS